MPTGHSLGKQASRYSTFGATKYHVTPSCVKRFMKHVLPLPVLQFPVLGVRDCVKCKLAPHGFAATYLTVLQQCSCSSLQRSQRWRLLIHMLLRKITKYNIHLRFTVCPVRHCIHAHSRGAEANFSSALSAHNS